jgi:hypothetical protein
MRRVYIFLLIGAAVVLFVAVSAILARVFSVDGAERSAITTLVQDEARGDVNGAIAQITNCDQSAACRNAIEANVAALRRPGTVSILQIEPSAGFSLGSTLGIARVAWSADSSLPIVQCVRVRRAGNALSGLHVELLEISKRIESDSVCPTRF